MFKQLTMITAFVLCVSIGSLAAQEKVVVGGSGAMTTAMEALVKAYKQKHPTETLDVMSEPMSTTGGIEGTKAGRLTVGIITRALNDEEKREGLVYRAVTRIPVVVGVHKSLPVSNLTDSQVCDIFSGKIKSWKDIGGGDGKMIVLARKKDDNSMEIFREKMACFNHLQLGPDTVLLVRGNEVLDSLANRPGTVGITVAGSAMMDRPNIKAVAVGAISPTLEAVKGGKYKYFNEVGVVTIGEAKGTTRRFLEFVGGSEAEKIVEKFGMAAVR
jgi:phosphate transport system substrate-binding protein